MRTSKPLSSARRPSSSWLRTRWPNSTQPKEMPVTGRSKRNMSLSTTVRMTSRETPDQALVRRKTSGPRRSGRKITPRDACNQPRSLRRVSMASPCLGHSVCSRTRAPRPRVFAQRKWRKWSCRGKWRRRRPATFSSDTSPFLQRCSSHAIRPSWSQSRLDVLPSEAALSPLLKNVKNRSPSMLVTLPSSSQFRTRMTSCQKK